MKKKRAQKISRHCHFNFLNLKEKVKVVPITKPKVSGIVCIKWHFWCIRAQKIVGKNNGTNLSCFYYKWCSPNMPFLIQKLGSINGITSHLLFKELASALYTSSTLYLSPLLLIYIAGFNCSWKINISGEDFAVEKWGLHFPFLNTQLTDSIASTEHFLYITAHCTK